MNEQVAKKLRLMRFWLLGGFIIIIGAGTTFFIRSVPSGGLLLRELNYWIAVVAIAVLFVAWYYFYKWLVGRS